METTKTFAKEEIIFQQGERSKYAYIMIYIDQKGPHGHPPFKIN